ncbi:MAG TPA: divergent PAP2 family protein [Longimicrobiales bacterium]
MNVLQEAPALTIALVTLFSAQLLKFLGTWLVARRVDFTRLTGMGGMPSAHAASVSALSTCVGLEMGWGSTLFGAVAFFSVLIIYDAAGIRQAASRQAQLLNQMLEDLKTHHTIRGERLVERLGHTYAEVFVGATYGVLLALLLHP